MSEDEGGRGGYVCDLTLVTEADVLSAASRHFIRVFARDLAPATVDSVRGTRLHWQAGKVKYTEIYTKFTPRFIHTKTSSLLPVPSSPQLAVINT